MRGLNSAEPFQPRTASMLSQLAKLTKRPGSRRSLVNRPVPAPGIEAAHSMKWRHSSRNASSSPAFGRHPPVVKTFAIVCLLDVNTHTVAQRCGGVEPTEVVLRRLRPGEEMLEADGEPLAIWLPG